jgi:hypothetical protein
VFDQLAAVDSRLKFSHAAHDSLAEVLCCVVSLPVRDLTFVSQSVLALLELERSALPSSCFQERIQSPWRRPHQSAIHSNGEPYELEIRSIRLEIFD